MNRLNLSWVLETKGTRETKKKIQALITSWDLSRNQEGEEGGETELKKRAQVDVGSTVQKERIKREADQE